MATILVCPSCQKSTRTNRELKFRAKVRCPHCDTVSRCFIHGNGAIELRQQDSQREEAAPPVVGTLPPRVGDDGDNGESARRKLPSRPSKRPIGGYMPFEKSRSWIGMFAIFAVLGIVVIYTSWFCFHVDTMARATGSSGGNIWKSHDEGKRKEFQERQKKAIARLKAQNSGDNFTESSVKK
jgi:hypothetical protein